MSKRSSRTSLTLNVDDILKAAEGRLLQGKRASRFKGVSIDTRTLKRGELFIAIEGAKLDGHKFISEAVKKKAAAVLVSQKVNVDKDTALILVKDTTKALGHIAAYYRKKFKVPVIAITGSAGKTTTKELISYVLQSRFKVLKNYKTENNQYGVPLTLLKLDPTHQVVVLELGTNHFGEISWLAKIASPDVAVFTNIGESHLEGLKSPRGVFKEKFQLIKFLNKKGSIIFNGDDQYLKEIAQKKLSQRKIPFATQEPAEYKASNIIPQGTQGLEFHLGKQPFTLKTLAQHNVYNALAALSCARLLGLSFPAIKKSLAGFRFGDGRQEIKRIKDVWLIDDTYNSNPLSLTSAIRTLSLFPARGKKILVCGDMLELGKKSRALHEKIGKVIEGSSLDCVLTVGSFARYTLQAINGRNPGLYKHHCADLNTVEQKLGGLYEAGDIILIKGSRGMRMERVVQFMEKKLTQ